MADARQVMRCQLSHLRDLGHRRTVYFEQSDTAPSRQARLGAFADFCKGKELAPCPAPNVLRKITPGITRQVLHAHAGDLFDAPPRPTTLIADNRHAPDRMQALQGRGPRMPEDLSVIDAHGRSHTHLVRPALTHNRRPIAAALYLLLERIRAPEQHTIACRRKPVAKG